MRLDLTIYYIMKIWSLKQEKQWINNKNIVSQSSVATLQACNYSTYGPDHFSFIQPSDFYLISFALRLSLLFLAFPNPIYLTRTHKKISD